MKYGVQFRVPDGFLKVSVRIRTMLLRPRFGGQVVDIHARATLSDTAHSGRGTRWDSGNSKTTSGHNDPAIWLGRIPAWNNGIQSLEGIITPKPATLSQGTVYYAKLELRSHSAAATYYIGENVDHGTTSPQQDTYFIADNDNPPSGSTQRCEMWVIAHRT